MDDFASAVGGWINDASDHIRRGRAERKAPAVGACRCRLSRAIQLSPNSGEGHFRLANLCLDQHKYAEALEPLTKAIELGTKSPPNGYLLADAFAMVGLCQMTLKDFRSAANDFTAALRQRPDLSEPLHESRASCLSVA